MVEASVGGRPGAVLMRALQMPRWSVFWPAGGAGAAVFSIKCHAILFQDTPRSGSCSAPLLAQPLGSWHGVGTAIGGGGLGILVDDLGGSPVAGRASTYVNFWPPRPRSSLPVFPGCLRNRPGQSPSGQRLLLSMALGTAGNAPNQPVLIGSATASICVAQMIRMVYLPALVAPIMKQRIARCLMSSAAGRDQVLNHGDRIHGHQQLQSIALLSICRADRHFLCSPWRAMRWSTAGPKIRWRRLAATERRDGRRTAAREEKFRREDRAMVCEITAPSPSPCWRSFSNTSAGLARSANHSRSGGTCRS